MAIRILDSRSDMMGLDDLGMEPELLGRYRRLSRFPGGILLVTGPTGSGKTTTLYSTVRERAGGMLRIVTVEDPGEFHLQKVGQVGVTEQMGSRKR